MSDSRAAIESAEFLIADFKAAIEQLRGDGLATNCVVYSRAPAVLLDPCLGAVPLDSQINETFIRAMDDRVCAAAQVVHEALTTSNHPDLAYMGALTCISFQIELYAARMIRPEFLSRPGMIALIRSENKAFENWLMPRMANALSTDSQVSESWFSLDRLDAGWSPEPPPPNLIERALHSDLASFKVKGRRWISRLAARRSRRADALVFGDNELLRHTLAALSSRGCELGFLQTPGSTGPDTAGDAGRSAAETAYNAAAPHFESLLEPKVWSRTAKRLKDVFEEAFAAVTVSTRAWHRHLENIAGPATAILHSGRRNPATIALHNAARCMDLKTFTFQHGTTREYNRMVRNYKVLSEGCLADVNFVYCEAAKQYDIANPMNASKPVVVGWPDTAGVSRTLRKLWPRRSPIMYVSTAIYRGNIGMNFLGLSDRLVAEWEMRLLDRVFARLPHEVVYKPYPASRYLDPDPVLDAARRVPNVTVAGGERDLKYSWDSPRLIVTSRASSTLAACLRSDTPALILHEDWMSPLTTEAVGMLKNHPFLIDTTDEDGIRLAQTFLSRSIEDIERDWAEHLDQMNVFIDAFIGTRNNNAGEACADEILNSTRTSRTRG